MQRIKRVSVPLAPLACDHHECRNNLAEHLIRGETVTVFPPLAWVDGDRRRRKTKIPVGNRKSQESSLG